jgi:G3E family GTPase
MQTDPILQPNHSIPVFLITGFLGVGKTTFLKNMLEQTSSCKTGLIINEFGKISVDGKLIQRDGLDMVELTNGSIFCVCLKDSFKLALMSFSNMGLERVLIESSGLSDPSTMEHILEGMRAVTEGKLTYAGSCCIISPSSFLNLLESVRAIEQQVMHSHLVVLNKTDLVSSEELHAAENAIRERNPYAQIIPTMYGKVDPQLFTQSWNIEIKGTNPSTQQPSVPNRPKTFVIKPVVSQKRENTRRFVESLLSFTFRVKGFMQFDSGWYYVDGSADQCVLEQTEQPQTESYLVVIARDTAPITSRVKALWKEWGEGAIQLE